MIRHHHEFYNGQGYPDGLKENDIPVEARILAVADAIDAMTYDRPYRKGLSVEAIIVELDRHRNTQFDPLIVDAAAVLLTDSSRQITRPIPSRGSSDTSAAFVSDPQPI